MIRKPNPNDLALEIRSVLSELRDLLEKEKKLIENISPPSDWAEVSIKKTRLISKISSFDGDFELIFNFVDTSSAIQLKSDIYNLKSLNSEVDSLLKSRIKQIQNSIIVLRSSSGEHGSEMAYDEGRKISTAGATKRLLGKG